MRCLLPKLGARFSIAFPRTIFAGFCLRAHHHNLPGVCTKSRVNADRHALSHAHAPTPDVPRPVPHFLMKSTNRLLPDVTCIPAPRDGRSRASTHSPKMPRKKIRATEYRDEMHVTLRARTRSKSVARRFPLAVDHHHRGHHRRRSGQDQDCRSLASRPLAHMADHRKGCPSPRSF